MRYILALDQGTTSSRAILFDEAGGPVANDNVACRLRPLDRADYGAVGAAFTAERTACASSRRSPRSSPRRSPTSS